jgi:thiamine pyrophosphokinase
MKTNFQSITNTLNLANLYLVAKYVDKIHLQLLTNYSTIEAIIDDYSANVQPGEKISLLPVGKAVGVTTTGLEYPLENEHLELGTRGVSNRANAEKISVSVQSGALLIFRNYQ